MRNLLMCIMAGCVLIACNQPKPEPVAEAKQMPLEFGDSTNVKTCKQALMSLASGDIDAFTSNLADNVVYQWNAGDSLAGKAVVVEYWKDRRTNVIDKMEISGDIWLSLKVNESKQVEAGDYVFAWFRTTASYKGGKSMSQFVHNIYHFDASGKVDRVTQFVDRAPIMAAMPAKK